MSWSRRLALAAVAAAAGCGFRPVLAPGGAADGLRGAFAFRAPENRAGYHLLRRLEERLGLPDAPSYEMRATVRLAEDVTGLSPDRVAARTNVVAEVRYEVADLRTGTVLRRGRVESFTGYSTTSTAFASEVARAAARERLMTLLADRIAQEVLASADEWRR